MPGGVRWRPEDEPFSYWKLCLYYLPGLALFLWMLALLVSMFGGLPWLWRWLDQVDKVGHSSELLRVAMLGAFVGAYYLFFMKVLWNLLPANMRARIPYDRKEAIELKGDIRSVWDLRKLIIRTPRS